MKKRTMLNRMLIVLFLCIVGVLCNSASAQEVSEKSCIFDRARLLALDEIHFDQDLSGGWRQLASTPGCSRFAADLLRDYREVHHIDTDILFWHEAQVRANDGQYPEAIALMKRAYKPHDQDRAGWNPYVEATIAFLSRDRAALEQAKSKLAAVRPPTGADIPPVINGYMEVEMADGSKRKIRWPQNIDVVEGLENCFDRPYVDAYKEQCRKNSH